VKYILCRLQGEEAGTYSNINKKNEKLHINSVQPALGGDKPSVSTVTKI